MLTFIGIVSVALLVGLIFTHAVTIPQLKAAAKSDYDYLAAEFKKLKDKVEWKTP